MNPTFAIVLGVRPMAITAAIVGFIGFGMLLGYPLSRALEANPRSRPWIAWVIGLAMYPALAGVVFHVVPFTPIYMLGLVALLVACAWAYRSADHESLFHTSSSCGPFWIATACIIALLPTLSVVPQPVGKGVEFGHPIFDHSKTAIVDAIARDGLPPPNPFFTGPEINSRPTGGILVYYYGWHLTAAHARLLGVSALEADIALTYVTALAWLCLTGWVAAGLSRSRWAAWWVLAIALTASLRPAIDFTLGPFLPKLLVPEHGLETWLIQSAWVPQHVFSTVCGVLGVLFAVLCMSKSPCGWIPPVVGGLTTASAYICSAWVGGLGLAAVFATMMLVTLRFDGVDFKRDIRRLVSVAGLFATASMAAAVFLAQHATVARDRSTVSLRLFPVLSTATDLRGNVLNVVGYWIILLPIEFGFAYVLTGMALRHLRRPPFSHDASLSRALTICAIVPLLVAALSHSTIANNDLGWRVVLISVFGMTVLSAVYADRAMAGLISESAFRCTAALAATLLVPAALAGLQFAQRAGLSSRLYGAERPAAVEFVREPELWEAVRAVTLPDEVVVNNPLHAAEITPWPANLGWALFGDRRHCAAGWELLRAYAPHLGPEKARRLHDWLSAVFAGNVTAEDLRVLEEQHDCATLVVVPSDGLWGHPILDSNPYYRLVDESPNFYRLYRR